MAAPKGLERNLGEEMGESFVEFPPEVERGASSSLRRPSTGVGGVDVDATRNRIDF